MKAIIITVSFSFSMGGKEEEIIKEEEEGTGEEERERRLDRGERKEEKRKKTCVAESPTRAQAVSQGTVLSSRST